MQAKKIKLCNEELLLDPRKCIYWAKHKALILSDWHIGKSAHFRKHGIAIPQGVLQKDLDTVDNLLSDYIVKEIWVIGDMFHAQYNSDLEVFAVWRKQHSDISIKLIGGNHDVISKKLLGNYDIDFMKSMLETPFYFEHKPLQTSAECFQISGHIHPGVELHGLGNLKIKLPCFIVGEGQLILPAFSNFTGLDTRYKLEDSTVKKYVIANNFVELL